MIDSTTEITKTENGFSINLISFGSKKSFDDVIASFEKLLGKFDEAEAIASGKNLVATVKQMEGPLGLMIIGVLLMDRILPSFSSSSIRARQYQIGNPLIASEMAQHNTLAALYAPPRVLVYTRDANTWISYDQPSTCFGRLGSDDILKTGKALDEKFETLARRALS